MLGEVKYVEAIKNDDKTRLIHEMKDYLSIIGESTSDWGHDFAFGILYEFGGDTERVADQNLQLWESDRIFLSCFRRS